MSCPDPKGERQSQGLKSFAVPLTPPPPSPVISKAGHSQAIFFFSERLFKRHKRRIYPNIGGVPEDANCSRNSGGMAWWRVGGGSGAGQYGDARNVRREPSCNQFTLLSESLTSELQGLSIFLQAYEIFTYYIVQNDGVPLQLSQVRQSHPGACWP